MGSLWVPYGVAPCSPRASRRHSGVLSAFGLALADVVHEAQEPAALRYEPHNFALLDERIAELSQRCCAALRLQGFRRWGGSRGRGGTRIGGGGG